jgi:Spy/CpxP family protein refolding chaperone
MRRAWRVLFWIGVAASLLLNAVVLGLYLRTADMRGVVNGGGLGFGDLPRGIRQEFFAVLREDRASLRGPLRDLGQARRAMFEAARARPYDRAAVEAAMVKVRTASAALQLAGQDLLLKAFDRAADQD